MQGPRVHGTDCWPWTMTALRDRVSTAARHRCCGPSSCPIWLEWREVLLRNTSAEALLQPPHPSASMHPAVKAAAVGLNAMWPMGQPRSVP